MQKVKTGTGTLERAFAIIQSLADAKSEGARVTQIAREIGLTQGTVHRTLRALVLQNVVEQDERTKHYRLSVDFFVLASKAGNPLNLREICRPILLRLCASLGDTLFLLARSGFDAVCIDRSEGPYPIRSFTGDIGGRIALGVGQGSLAILAFLPEAERDEVIRFNVPRIRELGTFDEVYLRTEIAHVRELGFAAKNTGLLEGMAGVAVPILDRGGRAVAALSVGTISARLNPDRLPTVVALLQKEADRISSQINPFDPTLRRPVSSLAAMPSSLVSN
jgi:DNA-binding IclR family transcriptional regulator